MVSITSEISITSDWYQPIFLLVIDITFWITSDFSIHLMQLTSKVQTPISFLYQVWVGIFLVGT